MSFNFAYNLSFVLQTETPALTTTQRNESIDVQIFPQWFKQATVQWSVPAHWGACLFDVYFSPREDGDFTKLNATPLTGTYFIDTTTREERKFQRGYYVVEVILLDRNNFAVRSDPKSWDTYQRDWVTLRSMEIQRREYWLLSRFVGIKSYLFRRKTYGKRCTACWDVKNEKVLDDHCPTCLGTSFEGGYFDFTQLFLQYDPTPNSITNTYFGKDEENQIGAWTISIPDVRPDDIILRSGDWTGYIVSRIGTTELQGNVVRQTLTLTQLNKGSVEFQLMARNLPDFPSQYLAGY